MNERPSKCPVCEKTLRICFCSELKSVATKTRVVILQHPQEPREILGTARLANLSLSNSELRIGLSWRNLTQAVAPQPKKTGNAGPNPASALEDPARWAVLYLGSQVKDQSAATSPSANATITHVKPSKLKDLRIVKQRQDFDFKKLKGLIFLDGTWSQAKALWWRNAWLLKINRFALEPSMPSLYGKLRKEPRREAVSTIEAIALTLDALGEDPQIKDQLIANFQNLLKRVKNST